jgi:orotidine-5'-phosphate decarboxylase
MNNSKIIIALDFSNKNDVDQLVEKLDPSECRLKVGKELFTRFGPNIVKELHDKQFEIFLDLKFHDIPNTVAQACLAAADLGVWMMNVHAIGGARMMAAAREALDKHQQKPLLIAVTILTSMQSDELAEIGIHQPAEQAVDQLASLAKAQGLDGVVCSAMEAERLRSICGDNFKLVTPGIRLPEDSKGDQRRVMTPQDALNAGADYLVIGRSITAAADPLEKLRAINSEIHARYP